MPSRSENVNAKVECELATFVEPLRSFLAGSHATAPRGALCANCVPRNPQHLEGIEIELPGTI